jgi:small subunit ribosomal protein S16
MLMIRLQRVGRINDPSYRLVVVERARAAKAGKYVEKVGSYNPKSKKRVLETDRIKYWMSVGAKPTGTVHNMLISAGILTGKKINVLPQKSPPKVAEATPATA